MLTNGLVVAQVHDSRASLPLTRTQCDNQQGRDRTQDQGPEEPVKTGAVLALGKAGIDQCQRSPPHDIAGISFQGTPRQDYLTCARVASVHYGCMAARNESKRRWQTVARLLGCRRNPFVQIGANQRSAIGGQLRAAPAPSCMN